MPGVITQLIVSSIFFVLVSSLVEVIVVEIARFHAAMSRTSGVMASTFQSALVQIAVLAIR